MKPISLALLFLLFAYPAWAAVGFDAGTPESGIGVTGISFSHATAGSNRHIAVCASTRNSQVGVSATTYNTVALTEKAAVAHDTFLDVECWESTTEPTVGTNTVAITLGGTANLAAAAVSFSGVHQSSRSGTAATACCGSGSLSVNVTVPSGGMAYDVMVVGADGHTFIVGSGQTLRASEDDSTDQQLRMSTSPDVGTNSMDWSWSPDDHASVLIAVPLNAAIAAGTPARRRTIAVE